MSMKPSFGNSQAWGVELASYLLTSGCGQRGHSIRDGSAVGAALAVRDDENLLDLTDYLISSNPSSSPWVSSSGQSSFVTILDEEYYGMLLALTILVCVLHTNAVLATAVGVRIECSDIHHCEGQFSDRGQRLCLAKELVRSLEVSALQCPTLAKRLQNSGEFAISCGKSCLPHHFDVMLVTHKEL